MRARAVHDALRLLDDFGPGTTQLVRDRVPSAALSVIDKTSSLGWIAIEDDYHVPSAIVAELGEARANAYFRWLFTRQLDSPLLSSTLAATRKLFGLSPAALARAAPLAWPMVYRDFCHLSVRPRSGHEVTIRLESVHPRVLEVPAYPLSFAGFFAGFFDACAVDGSVSIALSPEAALLELKLEW